MVVNEKDVGLGIEFKVALDFLPESSFQIPGADSTVVGANPFGQVSGGLLILHGMSIPGIIKIGPEAQKRYMEHHFEIRCRSEVYSNAELTRTPREDVYFKADITLHDVSGQTNPSYKDIDVQIIFLGNSGSLYGDRRQWALAVMPSSEDKSVFERVGIVGVLPSCEAFTKAQLKTFHIM